jgi:hypothetical protein
MKKLNWKCPTVKKMIVAACATGLLLFTMAAGTGLLNFDDLPNDTEGLAVPPGYGNLQWDNLYCVNGLTNTYNPSGYQTGVVSKDNVIFNGYGYPARIYVLSGGSFTPLTAYVTAAWSNNLKFEAKGYFRGRLVMSRSFILKTAKPTLVKFGVQVDELVFSTSNGPHGTHFAMDNLQVTRVNPGVSVPTIVEE